MKNTFRNNNEDSLRGTGFGSLSWSEANKQSKNAKRFVGSFDQDVDKNYNIVKKKKKEIVTFLNVLEHLKMLLVNYQNIAKVFGLMKNNVLRLFYVMVKLNMITILYQRKTLKKQQSMIL